jgi:hypothetical protein
VDLPEISPSKVAEAVDMDHTEVEKPPSATRAERRKAKKR